MASLSRLWRTVRHLKPIQIGGRLWFRLKRPRIDLSPAPALRIASGIWYPVPARRPSLTGPQRFCFLNAEHQLAEAGWDDPLLPKLWRYNLHYFDDLQAAGWQDRAAWHSDLIAAWIAGNPPGQGSGWEPYPTSLRIVNWVKWQLAGGGLSAEALASLAVQARALVSRMEWHLLGNHLFVNAKALLFAGHFFDGPEAAAWRAVGLAVLRRELDEQFLPDGGQFELSPMYHALGFEDLLDLLNLVQHFPGLLPAGMVARLCHHAGAARRWLGLLSHPDGQIAFFNDAAFGIAPGNADLDRYAGRLGIPAPPPPGAVEHLAASGYLRLAAGPAVLLADLARIGPDYLPGHAHADTLSFELSVFGQRVFVNSGTGEYGTGPERQRQRGTAAHNTVVLAGQDSSEVWGGFRVGRRAWLRDIAIETAADGTMTATATHDGYAHLPGRPLHRRNFAMTATGLRISDRILAAAGPGLAEARFHLHPAVRLREQDGQPVLQLPAGRILHLVLRGGRWRAELASWHPEFGLTQASTCLVLPLAAGEATFELCWG
jgi:uncharacterized heparinase superfamily protein